MSIIPENLSSIVPEINLDGLFSAEAAEMGSPFEGQSLFKYYSDSSFFLFDNFNIRYTQKSYLNDPFEFSQRWSRIASDDFKIRLDKYLRSSLISACRNKELLSNRIISEAVASGHSINKFHRAAIKEIFETYEGQLIVERIIDYANLMVDKFMDHFLNDEIGFKESVERKIIANTGVLSLTETISNSRMWAHYASSGRGYVAQLNARSPIFLVSNGDNKGKSAFRKVRYSDENIDSLFSNPYYMFLVKDSGWQFEKEWRAMKDLSKCDNCIKSDIFTDNLVKGSVIDITFGYNFDRDRIVSLTERICNFDSGIRFFIAEIDTKTREINKCPL